MSPRTEKALRRLMRPVISIALRRALPFQKLHALFREEMVSLAKSKIAAEGKKPSASHISLLTGIHRHTVRELLETEESPAEEPNIPLQVIGQWRNDRQFLTKRGRPRSLTHGEEQSEFSLLVKKVTRNIHPRTILNELERLSLVKKGAATVRLVAITYRAGDDEEQSFELLSRNVETVAQASEHNLSKPNEPPLAHSRTEYSNVYEKDAAKLQKRIYKETAKFHQRLDKLISSCDADIHPQKNGGAAGVSLSVASACSSFFPKK